MSDISHGPVSSLPYSCHALPVGAMCDSHPRRKAVARVQGETDSFGCEYNDVCKECLKEIQDYRESPEACSGMCEWCKKEATDLRDARDYDEGMAGRVYRVCGLCIKRRNDEAEEELRDSGYYDDCWDDDYEPEADEIHWDEVEPPNKPSPKVIPVKCVRCGGKWEPRHTCRKRRRR